MLPCPCGGQGRVFWCARFCCSCVLMLPRVLGACQSGALAVHHKMLPCPHGGQGNVSKNEAPCSKLDGCTRYFFSLVSLCLPLRALVEAFWFIFACFWPLKMPFIPASIVFQIWIAIYRWKALNVSFPMQLEAHQSNVCSSSYSPLK